MRKFVRVAKLVASERGAATVDVDSLDGRHLRLRLDIRGWTVEHADNYYETLHSLLVHESPSYKGAFDGRLMAQLQGLAKQQQQQQV